MTLSTIHCGHLQGHRYVIPAGLEGGQYVIEWVDLGYLFDARARHTVGPRFIE